MSTVTTDRDVGRQWPCNLWSKWVFLASQGEAKAGGGGVTICRSNACYENQSRIYTSFEAACDGCCSTHTFSFSCWCIAWLSVVLSMTTHGRGVWVCNFPEYSIYPSCFPLKEQCHVFPPFYTMNCLKLLEIVGKICPNVETNHSSRHSEVTVSSKKNCQGESSVQNRRSWT